MKKNVLLVIFLLCSLAAFSQTNFGLKGGLNIADWSGDAKDVWRSSSRNSFHAGVYLSFILSDAFSIQPEVLYNSVGANTETIMADYFVLDYISIPLMVVFNFNQFISVQAGPQIGFLIRATANDKNGYDEVMDYFTGTDFGMNFGLGINLGRLNATARYSLGLTNVGLPELSVTNEEFIVKNNVIQVSLGLTLFRR
ncbi:MAG: PorT family protein [Cyclobacteriaceae bacterium]|nr:PorT family protein [Cyclobacteriaceae bacterium]